MNTNPRPEPVQCSPLSKRVYRQVIRFEQVVSVGQLWCKVGNCGLYACLYSGVGMCTVEGTMTSEN